MRLLLDTHTLLWWLEESPILSAEAYEAIAEPDNDVVVSAATVWELEIKRATGKLEAPGPLVRRITAEKFEPLPITLEHGASAGKLPLHHSDPFDRMLIAQAQIESLTLVTRDPRFAPYAVMTLAA
jgi:PIN domain nuclease of toxin-antitoxin system